jgi:hypothetical protein
VLGFQEIQPLLQPIEGIAGEQVWLAEDHEMVI